MTAVVTQIGSWESEHVTVSQVEAALSDLRHRDRRAAVRTSVLTLAAVVGDQSEADAALAVIGDLGPRHPSRAIVLVVENETEGATESGMDASASVQVIERDGRAVCSENIVLHVRGRARHHLDSIVEPFTLPDVPLVVWLPARLPKPGDPLMEAANRVVVDSRAVGESGDSSGVLRRSASLARRLPVADLSWIRLAPWRSLLAGLFQGAIYRPFLGDIHRVEIAGNYGPRHLLGGWLSRRLGVPRDRVVLSAAEHVAVRVTAMHEGRTGRFVVERTGPGRVIRAHVDIAEGPTLTQMLHMHQQWPSLALAGALTRVGHDRTYEEALAGARDLMA